MEHPVDIRFAVPFSDRVRGAFGESIPPGQILDEEQVLLDGFYLGPLNGRFYKPLHKCQEADLLCQSLAGVYPRAPFPVSRSLFLGILGALYSVQQNLDKILRGAAAQALPGYQGIAAWWKSRRDEIHRHGELLHYLQGLNNSDKHGSPSVPVGLKPKGRFWGEKGALLFTDSEYLGDALGIRMSAEGVFLRADFTEGYEQWNPHPDIDWVTQSGFHGAEFTFELVGLPPTHLGMAFPARDPVSIARMAIHYHYELIRDAIHQWRRGASG